MSDFNNLKNEDLQKKNGKLLILFIIIVSSFILYAIRLFSLQIVKGQNYRSQSERISTVVSRIPAQRGEIFDRNAIFPMVINNPSFAVDITPGEIESEHFDTVLTKLAGYLGMSKKEIDKKLPADVKKSFISYEVKNNVSFETISNIAENITDLPGVSWRNKPIRNYVETGSISHVLGYVGDITREELNMLYNKGYTRNSVIGKTGIEKQYDELLQGKEGSIIRTVDVNNRVLNNEATIIPPESGKNLVLTIDSTIQTLAEKSLGNRVGSAIVLKPATGEILAMVSYPYFDSNIFSGDDAASQYTKLINEKNNPLLNRSVNATYPPASTFKTIMTAAILNENAIPAEKKIECTGEILYGGRKFSCHIKKPGHGYLDLKNALAQSCDVYFWIVGRDNLGVEKISSYAQEFGFGKSLEIDLPSQSFGFVPTAQWKEKRFHEKWLGGDTMNISIGQGYTTVTPLHIANMMAMVVNKGIIYKPHLLKEVRDPVSGEIIEDIKPQILQSSTIPEDIWKTVQENLRYTITNGTASYPMNLKSVEIAGKTGTAEVNGYEKGHWHSWMVSYAPYNAPPEEQIVVVTLIEAVNDWEWWAPYANSLIIQGIFNDQTYEEAVQILGYKPNRNQGRRE